MNPIELEKTIRELFRWDINRLSTLVAGLMIGGFLVWLAVRSRTSAAVLRKIAEDNERLKHENQVLRSQSNLTSSLKGENEDLKRENQNLKSQLVVADRLAKDNQKMRLEIVSLKSQVSRFHSGTDQIGTDVEDVEEDLGYNQQGESDSLDQGFGPVESGEILGERGSYVIWVGPPFATTPRYVHFSWGGPAGPESFKIRDYIGGRLLQHRGATIQREKGFPQISECQMSRDEVWSVAAAQEDPIQAAGELYHKVSDFPWWKKRLSDMTNSKSGR